MPFFRIELGSCGPTDCCLVLSRSGHEEKEYLIESQAWRALSVLYRPEPDDYMPPIEADSYRGAICELIWEHCDSDRRNDPD